VDELLTNKMIGERQISQFKAAAEIRFDGLRYGAFQPQPLTKSPHEWRFSKDSSERALVAHVLAAARISDAQLSRREKPDFTCSIGGDAPFGLEVAEIHHPAHAEFQNNATAITLGVRDAIDEPERYARTSGVHCVIALGLSPSAADARRIRDELVAWVDEDLVGTPDGPLSFAAARHPLLAQHKPYGTILRGEGRSFMVKLPARSFSTQEVVPLALQAIQRKRSKKYEIPTPWLALGVTDMWGDYRASFTTLWQLRNQIELDPFKRVLLQNGGDILILGVGELYQPADKVY
jgi:hypothetical protein